MNSPGNPTGRVATVEELRGVVAWARETGTLLVSDECYLELGWEAEPVSLLHPDVTDGDVTGLLVAYSLSKQSNLAGYRAGAAARRPRRRAARGGGPQARRADRARRRCRR